MLKGQREIKFVSVKRLQTADCMQGIKNAIFEYYVNFYLKL